MSCQMENAKKISEVKHFTEPGTEIQPPDGGWGWTVCFASFMTIFTVSGIISSNGIILLALLDLFNESVSKTSLVGSIISGASMFGGPFVLLLITFKASHRQVMMMGGIIAAASAVASSFAPNLDTLIVTYGILAGISLAINFFAVNVILGCYFTKKRALAIGLANSGAGSGSFLLSFLTERSISFYGIRGTFLLIGGLFLNMIVYGALCRPLKPVIKHTSSISETQRNSADENEGGANIGLKSEDDNSENQDEKTAASCQYTADVQMVAKEESALSKLVSRYCDATIFQNKIFGLLVAIFVSWSVGDSLVIYLPAYAESVGLSRTEGAMIISIVGITSTLSQLFVGFLADVVHIPISYLLFSSLLGMSLGIASIPHCQTFATLASTVVVCSTAFNFGISLRVLMVAAIFGIENMSSAYSIMSMLMGIGFSVYPICAGLIYDATRSFAIIFYVESAIAFLGAILSTGLIYAQTKGKFSEK